jgi:hypothetical protein
VQKVLAILILSVVFITGIFAQDPQDPKLSVIASGGDYVEKDGYSLSYTFGECATKTYIVSTMAFTQGFQQGKFNSPEPSKILELKVYPNPVTNDVLHITLPVRNDINSYLVSFYTSTGQVLLIKQFKNLTVGTPEDFDFSPLAKGLYLVKIQSTDNTFLKIFKIEKR